jgi:hypothetical protein
MSSALRVAVSFCLGLLCCALAPAQDRVSLKDGNVLEGKVRSVGSTKVVMEAGGMVVELRRAEIADIELAPEKAEGAAFGITAIAPAPAPRPKAKLAPPREAPAPKAKPVVEAAPTPAPVLEESAAKKKRGAAVREIELEPESGWKALLQNRLGLDPNQPERILLYALLAFVVVMIVVAIAARLADFYSRSGNRVAGFSACTVLLVVPQIVWLPADARIVACALTADFVLWCLLVRLFFREQLLKSCVLLVGSAFVLLLVALAGEVGRMMLAEGASGAASVGAATAAP